MDAPARAVAALIRELDEFGITPERDVPMDEDAAAFIAWVRRSQTNTTVVVREQLIRWEVPVETVGEVSEWEVRKRAEKTLAGESAVGKYKVRDEITVGIERT